MIFFIKLNRKISYSMKNIQYFAWKANQTEIWFFFIENIRGGHVQHGLTWKPCHLSLGYLGKIFSYIVKNIYAKFHASTQICSAGAKSLASGAYYKIWSGPNCKPMEARKNIHGVRGLLYWQTFLNQNNCMFSHGWNLFMHIYIYTSVWPYTARWTLNAGWCWWGCA